MTRDELLQIIREATAGVLGVAPDAIQETSHFADDLEADSLALVEIIMEVEDRLDLQVPEDEIKDVETVGAAVDLIHAKLAQPA